MTKRILVLLAGLWACLNLVSCSGYKSAAPSGFINRALASQSVTSTFAFGGLVTVNGFNDTLPGIPPLSAGTSPGLMAVSPARNIVIAFDSASNSVFAADTTKEAGIGQVRLPGPTFSMTVPTSNAVGYAAVPNATVTGFPVLGAVVVMNFPASSVTTTIAVANAQTVIPNADGSQLLVFSNDSDTITLLSPARALPGVDLSCLTAPNEVCTIISNANVSSNPNLSRPAFAIVNQTTAYIFNCGFECGGTQQASVQTLDLTTHALGAPVNVNGATYGFLSGTNLYVAGLGTPTGPLCSSLTNPINPQTAATFCGTLDIVDLTTMTDPFFGNAAAEIAIPDGYHSRMDMSINGQLFVGSTGCQDIGDVANPVGEVRGCLAIYNTNKNTLVIPPDNGDVGGLQSFTSREIEYVAEGGELRVYDTTIDKLLINDFVPQGTINIIGHVSDIKAIDFF